MFPTLTPNNKTNRPDVYLLLQYTGASISFNIIKYIQKVKHNLGGFLHITKYYKTLPSLLIGTFISNLSWLFLLSTSLELDIKIL